MLETVLSQLKICYNIARALVLSNSYCAIMNKIFFTITAEIHTRSLANLYCQYADRHMNLKFMQRVSVREPVIRQFVIVKNKLM